MTTQPPESLIGIPARELIEEARDAHPLFDDERIPNKVMLRRLGVIWRELLVKAVKIDQDALAKTRDFDRFDIVDALAERQGLKLPETFAIRGIAALALGNWTDVLLVPSAQAAPHPGGFPAAYRSGERLHLIDMRDYGQARHGWENVEHMQLRYVPAPTGLYTMESKVALPESARPAVCRALESFMARRLGITREMPYAEPAAREAEAGFLEGLRELHGATSWQVRIV